MSLPGRDWNDLDDDAAPASDPGGVSRRRFLGYVIAASTPVAGAGEFGVAPSAAAVACAYARAIGSCRSSSPSITTTHCSSTSSRSCRRWCSHPPTGSTTPTDPTIEELADTVDSDLHPVQEAWLEHDVAQCGYCQPGQIMAAVAKVKRARSEGHDIGDADLDEIRNVCRCGTYSRIREAIKAGAQHM